MQARPFYYSSLNTVPFQSGSLALEFIGDLHRSPYPLRAEKPVTLGRAADSDVILLAENVSRRHATIVFRGATPLITDLASTHGTHVNSLRIPANQATPLSPGDLIHIGPFLLRLTELAATPKYRPSTVALRDDTTLSSQVQPLASVTPHAGKRLRALTECIAKLDAATRVEDAAMIAIGYALDASGYAHAAVLRRIAESEVVVVASRQRDSNAPASIGFSRSLIASAESGKPAVLAPQSRVTSHSLVGMNVHSALCAPIHIGQSIAGFLYLDARDQESPVDPDAAGFCEALATALGLTFANIVRAELERRQLSLAAELAAAHEAQQFILPEGEGEREFLSYGMRMRPGAFVAGDLFDVVPLGDGRVAVAIGDVAGHGIGSAMLMASTQSFLNAQLIACRDPAEALTAVNAYVSAKALGGKFVSLWVGVFSPDGSVEYVDAGHGHWLYLDPEGRVQEPQPAGAIPVGVSQAATFRSSAFTIRPGGRVVLYTDGVIEQRNAAGTQFGATGIRALLNLSSSPAQLVQNILEQVVSHSPDGTLEDDATVACIQYAAPRDPATGH